MSKLWREMATMLGRAPALSLLLAASIALSLFAIEGLVGRFDPYSAAFDPKYRNLATTIWFTDRFDFEPADPEFHDAAEWTRYDIENPPSLNNDKQGWLRVPLDIDPADVEEKGALVFLAGMFAADIYWNGELVSQKTHGGAAAATSTGAPFSVYVEIPLPLISKGSNELALHAKGVDNSPLLHRDVQVISVNTFAYGERNRVAYYFALAFVLLLAAFPLISGISLYVRQSLKKLVLLQVLLTITGTIISGSVLIILWLALEQPTQSLNYLIPLYYANLSIGLFAGIYAIELSFNMGALITNYILPLVVCWVVMFAPGNFLEIFLRPQLIASVFLALRLLMQPKVLVNWGWTIAPPLLLFWAALMYKPNFMANQGIYIFASVLLVAKMVDLMFEGGTSIFSRSAEDDRLLEIYSKGRRELVRKGDIAFIDALGHYAEITTVDDKKFIYQHGITSLLDQLPRAIVRVHRSHAVNLRLAKQILMHPGNRVELQLKNGTTLPVGRKYLKSVRALWR